LLEVVCLRDASHGMHWGATTRWDSYTIHPFCRQVLQLRNSKVGLATEVLETAADVRRREHIIGYTVHEGGIGVEIQDKELTKLVAAAHAHADFHVDAPGAHQGRVEHLRVIGRHNENTAMVTAHAVQVVQQCTQ
jgi:hypothetical protein